MALCSKDCFYTLEIEGKTINRGLNKLFSRDSGLFGGINGDLLGFERKSLPLILVSQSIDSIIHY